MAGQIPFRIVGLAAVWLAAVLWAAAPARGQQPAASSPFDGEWTLTFNVATPPGGVVLPYNSPYHMGFHAYKRSFQVQADGTFAWRDVDDGGLEINTIVVGTTKVWEKHRPLLKASGKATATPTPPGSPQPYDRALQIDLHWTGGSGAHGDDHGGSGAYMVDAAGEQMTVTGVGGPPTTLPVTYWPAKWQNLEPTSTVREEISPDVFRETITYKESRQAEVETKLGKYKVTERIEVKHVRYPNWSPRLKAL